jgi:hypothetical protein
MNTALLHVGPHKTGSTYLQACFRHHRAALRARGVVVPAAWELAPGVASHARLAEAVREGGDLAQAAEILADAFADGGDTLLVSAERISGLDGAALRRLRGLLGGCAVTVVFYVRRWSDLLPSAWQELVKRGETRSFPEFLAANIRNPERSLYFNLDMKLQALVEVFGQENVRLVCYSVLRDASADLFDHFAQHFLGWPDAPTLPGAVDMNVSRTAEEIELVRRLNMIDIARTGAASAALRNSLDAASPAIDTSAVLAAMAGSRRTMLLSDAFPALQQLHRRLSAKYRAQIVAPAASELMFTPMRREIPYIADDYVMRRGAIDEIYRIYDRIKGKEALLF